jgi:hypothetical protein
MISVLKPERTTTGGKAVIVSPIYELFVIQAVGLISEMVSKLGGYLLAGAGSSVRTTRWFMATPDMTDES